MQVRGRCYMTETGKEYQAPNQPPSLGVIIVNYNYGRFVADAIESVLNQNEAFDEIVVVDDGSTDRSLQVIEAYQPRVRVISKENGGQLSACLAGLAAIKTDYIYILDADDYVSPGFVGIAKAHLAERPAKVQFQLIGVDGQKNPLGSTFPTYPKGYGAMQMVQDNRVIGFYLCPPTSGNIYRRDVITEMKFHLINLREPVDGSPTLAIPYLGAVKSVNKPVGYYRLHGQNHSRWDNPDVSLLQFEIDWFHRRWVDVCNLLDLDRPPFDGDEPLYVLERRLMQSALTPGARVAGRALLYLRRLQAAHLLRRQKMILMAWAVAIALPFAKWRRKLVFARRSARHRPLVFKRLMGLLTNSQSSVLAAKLESEPPSAVGSFK